MEYHQKNSDFDWCQMFGSRLQDSISSVIFRSGLTFLPLPNCLVLHWCLSGRVFTLLNCLHDISYTLFYTVVCVILKQVTHIQYDWHLVSIQEVWDVTVLKLWNTPKSKWFMAKAFFEVYCFSPLFQIFVRMAS